MPRALNVVSRVKANAQLASFTLIELLTVMLIISLLIGLVLMAGSGAINRAKRARATGEIQAMSTALEAYKTDNGVYPTTNLFTPYGTANSPLVTNSATVPYLFSTYDGNDGSSTGAEYLKNSRVLYMGLSGKTNYEQAPVAGVRAYMAFAINQVGDRSGANGASYVIDPWSYSYGYATGSSTSYPFNGNGFFDLWSTGGNTTTSATTNSTWISNWK